jgi:hypothetical protein
MGSTVSRTLGAFGSPIELEHGGKVYTASPVTQKVKSAFERWMQQRALGAAQALANEDPSMGRVVEAVLDRIDSGHYSYHGKRSLEAILTPDGYLTLTALIFGIDPDEAMALTMAIPGEVGSVVAQVIRDSFPDAKVSDPNAQGPGGK